jgi:hypothetical protein
MSGFWAEVQELGIVPMAQALADGAAGAAEVVTRLRLQELTPAQLNEQEYFWCTLCTACVKRRAINKSHRPKHKEEWSLGDPALADNCKLRTTVDKKYGNVLHMHHDTYVLPCTRHARVMRRR